MQEKILIWVKAVQFSHQDNEDKKSLCSYLAVWALAMIIKTTSLPNYRTSYLLSTLSLSMCSMYFQNTFLKYFEVLVLRYFVLRIYLQYTT
jgi:hypothetical protein